MPEHPGAQGHVAAHGARERGGDQHGEFERARRTGIEGVEDPLRPSREPERDQEHHQPGPMLAHQALAPAHPEAEAPVGRRVCDRRHGERQGAGRGVAQRAGQSQEQAGVGRRRGDPDEHEAHERRAEGQPPDPAQVGHRRGHDVDAGVGVIDPVNRDLMNAHPAALGGDQQLGVKEPLLVLDLGEQLREGVGADGLEPTLSVGELSAQGEPEDVVIGAGDELALGTAGDTRAVTEPSADGHLAVTRQQRRHQWGKRLEVGGQVDIHVGDDARGSATRRRAERDRGPWPRGARP